MLDLVSSWSAAPIDALVAFPSGPSHPSLSWECKEGLLLTYELMLNFVLAAHRRKLHPYASLTAVKARVSVTSVPAKRETSRPTSPASSTPVRPAASEDKPTTSTILSPIMSPWLSSPGPDAAVAITPMPKPPVPALVLPNLRSDSPVRRSLQPPSFLDKLRVAVAAAGRETIWWRIVTQLVDAVSDGGFELRRMADQVLPLLTEALVWADLPSLHRLWACMTPCASSHLTPACLVIGRTISLIIRRLKRLHLNLIALGVSGSTGVDITTGRPAGSPLQCPTCAFPILTSDTLVTADTQWLCHCPAGRVQRVSTQVRHLVNLHLHDMLSLCLGAPSDAVLVLMCETLLLVREHLASFPDSLPQDNVPVDGSVGEEDVVAPPSAPLPRLLSVVLNRVFQVISIFDRSGLPESVSSSLTPPVRVSLTRSPAVSTVRTVADVGTEPFESPLLSPVYSRRYLSALKVSGCFTPDSSSGLSSPALSDVSADVTQSPRAIRNNRAQLLDRSLSSSLSPLFPQLLPLLTANEKLCLLPLVVYWGLRHSDAPTRAMNMDISSTCLSDILSSAEVRSVCNTKCVQALSGGSVVWGSTISSASPSKVVRPRPSPLSVSNSPDAVIPDNVHPFAREVLVAVSNTTSSLVSALSNPALDVASLRLCLAPLKVILLQSLLFPVFEGARVLVVLLALLPAITVCVSSAAVTEVLTAFAGRFRNAMSVGGDSSSRWARVGASSSQVDLRLDRFGLDEPSGRSAPSTPNFSTHALSATFEQIPGLLLKAGGPDGVSLAGANDEDVKGGAVPSPLPIPDPKLWRGPMLDTAAARVTRTSGRLMGLSLDFSSDGMTPLLDGGESPQLQPQSGRSSARKSKPRDPSDMVDVAVDAITLSVDVDGAVGSRPPSEGNPFASVPGEGAGWVRVVALSTVVWDAGFS